MIAGRFFLGLCAALLSTSQARAEWFEVKTDHFDLTIDDTEASARAFAERLEHFDAALRALYSIGDSADRRNRPVKVYALQSEPFMAACRCPGALGYYRTRPEGPYIFTAHMPQSDRKAKPGAWSSQTVLLHEYGHHFMYSNFPLAYPYWYSEGFAEFNANVSFEDDGSIILGYPANYRAEALSNGDVNMKVLMEPNTYGFDGGDRLYGRGWLLTHYLMLNPKRPGQLSKYLQALNKGTTSYKAAQATFGDLGVLDKELDAYRRGVLSPPLRIPPAKAPVRVEVKRLSKGQAEMLPLHLLFTDGIRKTYRMGHAMRAAKVGERYPDDLIVQEQLAEIEFIAERLDRADAAADRALKLDPNSVDAMVVKGKIAVQRLVDAKSSDAAAWTAARGWYLKANKRSPDAVMPLYLFHSSFAV
ncbi:MAG: hypothetical protein EOP60_17070, partial [Sphingomonadales bacterium]